MDSNSVVLTTAVIFMSILFGAFRFMRFIGVLTGAERKAKIRNNYPESHLSFDERVAERLRDLDRERS